MWTASPHGASNCTDAQAGSYGPDEHSPATNAEEGAFASQEEEIGRDQGHRRTDDQQAEEGRRTPVHPSGEMMCVLARSSMGA